ncbi:MAG: XdhC family protein, partial [Gemmatimonadaceae bacterium]|nr:XdhC family protein [Gemmatimonadaceae bacterium]
MSLAAILTECARLAAGGGVGALASVVRRRGSLPMSATAKLLVTADGARFGTVGGGCLEADVMEQALDVCERRVPMCTSHTLNAELAGDYGLTCGGTAEVFIEPVIPDAALAALYAEAAAVVARGDRAVLATARVWPDGAPRKVLLTAGRTIGVGDDAALRAAAADFDRRREEPALGDDLVVEALVGAPRLVVFGAGHVGARICEAAAFAGWRVTIVDDRAEFADAARVPRAERVLVCDFSDVRSAAVAATDCVVICTRGHQHDALIAAQVAPLRPRFIGMLGSRRKAALTAQALRGWGVDSSDVERIVCPVGLDVAADTPEEIAIAVVAQLVAVRRQMVGARGWMVDTAAAPLAGEVDTAT